MQISEMIFLYGKAKKRRNMVHISRFLVAAPRRSYRSRTLNQPERCVDNLFSDSLTKDILHWL